MGKKKKQEKAEKLKAKLKSGSSGKADKAEKSGKADKAAKISKDKSGKKSKDKSADISGKTKHHDAPARKFDLPSKPAAKPDSRFDVSETVSGGTSDHSVNKGRASGRPAKKLSGTPGAAELFRALGDENRLRILMLIRERELCATELLTEMDIVQSTLSHHMKILTESGLVLCKKAGRKVIYSIDSDKMEQINTFLDNFR